MSLPEATATSVNHVAPLIHGLLRPGVERLAGVPIVILCDILVRVEAAFGIDLDADEALATMTPLGLIKLVEAKVRALEAPAANVVSLCARRLALNLEPTRVCADVSPSRLALRDDVAAWMAGDDSPADAPAPAPKPAPVPAYASVSSFATPPAIPRRDPTSGARVEFTPGGGFAVYGLFDPTVWPRPHAKWVRHECAAGVFGRPLPASLGPAFPAPPPRPVLAAATPTGGWPATPQEPAESAHRVRAFPWRGVVAYALLALALVIVTWGRVDDDTARRAESPAAAALRGALS